MELILLEKVKNLGSLGDKINVKPGYGRNYLLPQGKAVRATAANLEVFDKRRAEYQAKADKRHADAAVRQAKLTGLAITIAAHASPEGKLYGSVGPREIVAALVAMGHQVDKSEVILGEGPLRMVGEFDVQIGLHADVHSTLKVTVVGEK